MNIVDSSYKKAGKKWTRGPIDKHSWNSTSQKYKVKHRSMDG